MTMRRHFGPVNDSLRQELFMSRVHVNRLCTCAHVMFKWNKTCFLHMEHNSRRICHQSWRESVCCGADGYAIKAGESVCRGADGYAIKAGERVCRGADGYAIKAGERVCRGADRGSSIFYPNPIRTPDSPIYHQTLLLALFNPFFDRKQRCEQNMFAGTQWLQLCAHGRYRTPVVKKQR
jgi:hypothetical protein